MVGVRSLLSLDLKGLMVHGMTGMVIEESGGESSKSLFVAETL